MPEPRVIVHNLESAAAWAKVTPDVIRRWIGDGLRACPVGRVGRRGPRDYRIFEAWLVTFLEARSTVAAPTPEPDAKPAAQPSAKPPRSGRPAGGDFLSVSDFYGPGKRY